METESDSWDSISGEINFRDTDNNESIFVQFNNEKVEDYRWGDDPKDTYEVLPAETVKKYLPEGYELVEGIYSVAGGVDTGFLFCICRGKESTCRRNTGCENQLL